MHVCEFDTLEQRKLQVNSGKNFSNADTLEQPVPAGLNDTFRKLSVIDGIFVLGRNHQFTLWVLLGELHHALVDEFTESVQNVCQQNELLWVEQGRSYIVE